MTLPGDAAEYRQAPYQPPPGSTELLLIRHGASAPARPGEPFPLVDGHGDPELASEGRQQAERVARRLGGERIDAIYVSPLRRTAQTAAPLVGHLALTPRVEAGLREVYLGAWEGGLYRQRVADNHPLAQRMFAEERWDVIPGGESTEAFGARVVESVEKVAKEHTGGRVAVFTHGGVIGQILAMATRSRPFAFTGADNGSISVVVVDGDDWIVRRFNDAAHLGESG